MIDKGFFAALIHYRDETREGALVTGRESAEQARADVLDAVGRERIDPDARLVVWYRFGRATRFGYASEADIVIEEQGRLYDATIEERRRKATNPGKRRAPKSRSVSRMVRAELADGQWHRKRDVLRAIGRSRVSDVVLQRLRVMERVGHLIRGRIGVGAAVDAKPATLWRIPEASQVVAPEKAMA